MRRFFKYGLNRIFSNVHHKYRLVIMNEAFEEKVSFRLSRLNVFVMVGMTGIVLVAGTIWLIAFTSLREFIPGYMKDGIVQMAYRNQNKIDSLENLLISQEKILHAMNVAISGELPIEQVEEIRDSAIPSYENIAYVRSEDDEALRQQVEQGEKFNLSQSPRKIVPESPEISNESVRTSTVFPTQSLSKIFFYVPLEGTIVKDFNELTKHFGVDITGRQNDVIKAVHNGTVISSEWTINGQYAITIQHANNMLSTYKHNSAVLKRVGDNVKAGEPIAYIGNAAEGYKGPILHFELWHNGQPVNPRNYIAF